LAGLKRWQSQWSHFRSRKNRSTSFGLKERSTTWASAFEYWNSEYPEIATATEKIATLESAGYDLVGYFVLPPNCWIVNYYGPTELRIPGFPARHVDEQDALQVAEMERHESHLYQRFRDWFSYAFYVARRRQSDH
jgi:hypothetical protein